MSVTIHCPHCGATGNAPDHILGQSVRCSKCKKQFLAGGEADESDEAPEEPADDFDDMDDAPPPRRRGGGGGRGRSSGGGGNGGGGGFGDFATFRVLVAPRIIVILFWVLVAFIILGVLGAIILSFATGGAMAGLFMLFLAPLGGLLYGLLFRISFEMMIVQFRILETLKELKKPG